MQDLLVKMVMAAVKVVGLLRQPLFLLRKKSTHSAKNFSSTAAFGFLLTLCFFILSSIISCSIITSFADTETVTFTVEGFPEEQIILTVRKNVCTPVLKEIYVEQEMPLESGSQDTFILYGTVYPYGTVLTKKDSFAADVLKTMYSSADKSFSDTQLENFLMRFNWQRFMEKCREYEDPWLLDKEVLMKAIASGSFKSTDFKLK